MTLKPLPQHTSSAIFTPFMLYTLAAGALWNVEPCNMNEPAAIKIKHVIGEQTFSMLVASSGTAAAMSCFS
jgi:hypothetical protein